MDKLSFDSSLSHTHYWYEIDMLYAQVNTRRSVLLWRGTLYGDSGLARARDNAGMFSGLMENNHV